MWIDHSNSIWWFHFQINSTNMKKKCKICLISKSDPSNAVWWAFMDYQWKCFLICCKVYPHWHQTLMFPRSKWTIVWTIVFVVGVFLQHLYQKGNILYNKLQLMPNSNLTVFWKTLSIIYKCSGYVPTPFVHSVMARKYFVNRNTADNKL